MSYTRTEELRRRATAAGVKDETLAPLKSIQGVTSAIRTAIEDLYEREQSNLKAAIGNGTTDPAELLEAAKSDAELSAQTRELENFTNYSQVEAALLEKVDIPALIDGCIADIQAEYATATSALQKLSDRWGSTNPDPGIVADQATPAELRQFRERTQHEQKLKEIKAFLEFLSNDYSFDRNPFVVIDITDLVPHYRRFSTLRTPIETWFIDDETGKLHGFHETRAKLNAAASEAEQAWHEEWWKDRPFYPKYTIDPKHKAKATFTARGCPTNREWLLDTTTEG